MNFMGWLTMFQADSGKTSSVRTGFLVTVFIVLLNWSYVNYQSQSLNPIPESVIVLVAALGGLKAYQGYSDKPLTTPPKSDTLKPE